MHLGQILLGCPNPTHSLLVCISALDEQLLLPGLGVAAPTGGEGSPPGARRYQPSALRHQRESCQGTAGCALLGWNGVQVLRSNFTVSRFSHDEKVFWHVAGN